MNICFCIDRGALAGLHVTLHGVFHYLGAPSCTVYLLHSGLSGQDFKELEMTVGQSRYSGKFEIVPKEIELSMFESFSSHFGQGWMAYARLLAPDLLCCERLLYLDADLLVYADLSELYSVSLHGSVLGAATWFDAKRSNDRTFYEANGFDLSKPYFNSGVLVLDCEMWRRQDWTKRCLEFGRKHNKNLPTVDQTILNVLMGGEFFQIARRFNTPVSAGRNRLDLSDLEDRIIHLVSRPKPWDPIGQLNGQYDYYSAVMAKTAIAGFQPRRLSLRDFRNYRHWFKCWKNIPQFWSR